MDQEIYQRLRGATRRWPFFIASYAENSRCHAASRQPPFSHPAAYPPAARLTVTTASNRPPRSPLAARPWRRFEWPEVALEQIAMGSFFHNAWDGAAQMPSQTWHWFMNLNREEWTVTLAVVCAIGFVALLGFQSRRI